MVARYSVMLLVYWSAQHPQISLQLPVLWVRAVYCTHPLENAETLLTETKRLNEIRKEIEEWKSTDLGSSMASPNPIYISTDTGFVLVSTV